MKSVVLLYYEPQASGQTTHVRSLAAGLDQHRFRVTVVLPEHLDRCAAWFHDLGVEVVPLPMRKVAWPWRSALSFYRMVRTRRPAIVHIHSQEAGLLGRVVAWLAGAPVLFYTPQTIDIRRSGLRWLYLAMECVLATITDTIVSVNDRDRRRLLASGIPPSKVVAVPNGIDLAAFEDPADAARTRQELGLDPVRPVVMQVGRLGAQKDPLTFVEGAARVLARCPHAQFALIGQGPLREMLAGRVAELGITDNVHLLGWRDEAFRLLPAADVVTLTSRWEGAPYVLLEAMGWSRPVVATAVNGCPEIVLDGDTGLLVPAADPAAWAEAVVSLLEDPNRARAMGGRGRLRIEERFTLDAMVESLEALYEDAAGPSSPVQGMA